MTPPEEETVLEVRLAAGVYPISRLITTITGKRMPLESLTLARDGEGRTHAALSLGCGEEAARRYAVLLSGLEDVEEATVAGETVEVVMASGGIGPAAEGITHTSCGELVLACGTPQSVESWLKDRKSGGEVVLRVGPLVRPGGGTDGSRIP